MADTYLEVDGWKFWTMGAPLRRTVVLNRARVTQPRARQQGLGRIA